MADLHQKIQSGNVQDTFNSIGDFRINDCVLLSSSGEQFIMNTQTVFDHMTINENLFGNFLTGTLVFNDANGWVETIPLIGDETLVVSFTMPGSTPITTKDDNLTELESSEEIIEYRFKVYDVKLEKTENQTNKCTLIFVSEEYITDTKTKVSKGITNINSEIVKTVYGELLSNKKLYVEKTAGTRRLIIPNWTPSQTFNYIATNSISAIPESDETVVNEISTTESNEVTTFPTGSFFTFFEKFGSGFFFQSIESLILKQKQSNKNIPTYSYRPNSTKSTIDNPGDHYSIVRDYFITATPKPLQSLINGTYGSKLIAVNPINLTFDEINMDYHELENETEEKRLHADFVTTDSTKSILDGKPLPNKFINSSSSYLGSNETTIHVASKFVKNENYVLDNDVDQWLLQRNVQINEFKNIQITMSVTGNIGRHVGDLIKFDFPTNYQEDTDIKHNQLYSGNYIVTKIVHRITPQEYMTDLLISKNSFTTQLSEGQQ